MFYFYSPFLLKGCYDFERVLTALENRIQGQIPSSDYDTISHLFLMITCAYYPSLRQTVELIENRAFQSRLQTASFELIQNELTRILDFLEEEKLKGSELMINVLKTLKSKASHAFGAHNPDCSKKILKLPFTFPLKMVSERLVELEKGMAVIPCQQWRRLLSDINNHLFHLEIRLIKSCSVLKRVVALNEDDRFRRIIFKLRRRLGEAVERHESNLNAEVIDSESEFFPPCMANLHQILRRTHRLSYDSRCDYTLFLKDIGLSVEENTKLWHEEYKKPHCGSNCTHYWQDKESRYKYQINHMYGLVGEGHPKSSRGCQTFIRELTSKSDGGCPFGHFSDEALRRALPKAIESSWGEIKELRDINEPNKCCAVYLSRLWDVESVSEIWSPLQFYDLVKKHLVK